jgi:hypothetical protein
MLQLDHKDKIVKACYPANYEEAMELWHDIKPVKFGNVTQWLEIAGNNELASYQIPQDASYLLILRVECYVTTFDPAAPAFGQFSPPPNSASTFWAFTDASAATPEILTPSVPIHLLCDVDEFLLLKGDHRATLLTNLPAPPDGNARFIRTTVYGYLCGALVAGKIGDSESTYFGDVQ